MSFTDRASACLHHIADLCDLIKGLDYEEDETSLTIELGRGRTYLFNIHNGLHQLWMASPISGGRHFEWCQSQYNAGHSYPWIDTRNKENLVDINISIQ